MDKLKLREIINKYDPMSILYFEEGKCWNEDEYDYEIEDIIILLNNNKNIILDEKLFQLEIRNIYVKWFYTEINHPRYDDKFNLITKGIIKYKKICLENIKLRKL